MKPHYTQAGKKQGFNFQKLDVNKFGKTKARLLSQVLIPQNIFCSNKRYYASCKPNRDCTVAQTVQICEHGRLGWVAETGFEY